jgi:hypothetical protein
MATRIALNGFGRMGRLALRAAWDWPELDIVHINEIAGDAATAAHLLQYDSVHGTWSRSVAAEADALRIGARRLGYSRNADIAATPWRELGVDLVVDCTGKFKSKAALAPYFAAGVRKVVVSAPVKDGTLNIVMGVNDHDYVADRDHTRFERHLARPRIVFGKLAFEKANDDYRQDTSDHEHDRVPGYGVLRRIFGAENLFRGGAESREKRFPHRVRGRHLDPVNRLTEIVIDELNDERDVMFAAFS